MDPIIDPRTLRGFRDFLPQAALYRERVQRRLEDAFKQFGFVPIDTPALEYAEILLGKGGGETDKQIYRFQDHGRRDVALRFDLTVPFARFMAQHLDELFLPFKRYHIGKVWRGENTQAGRYREFTQIDFDIVGADSAAADFEILLVILKAFAALGVERLAVHISHRGLLTGFLKRHGLEEQSLAVLRAVDKLKKIGEPKVAELLAETASSDQAKRILDFVRPESSFQATVDKLRELLGAGCESLERIIAVQACVESCGLTDRVLFDTSITRGLDYYTGVVYETFLTDLPRIGSVCSGGRYNDLASLYTREHLPGTGASIGLDRLMAALEELGLLETQNAAPHLLVLLLEPALLADYQSLAARFRDAGVSAEVFPQEKKLAAQFQYAQKRGIALALIRGEAERAKDTVTLKDLRDRRSYEDLSPEAAVGKARELLSLQAS